MAIKLKPCRACGAECSVQKFTGPHIDGVAKLWMCSLHNHLRGDCPDMNAYLSEEAWNTRSRPPLPDIDELVEQIRSELSNPARYYDSRKVGELARKAADAIESLAASREKMRVALEPLLLAAEGLSHGVDWNDGTHAKKHGYRRKLLAAIPRARKAYLGEEGK